MARRPKQTSLSLGRRGRKMPLKSAGMKASKAIRVRAVGGGNAAKALARTTRAQMTGRVPPLRGRLKGRAERRRNHPAASVGGRSKRAGAVLGKQAGFAAAGFAETARASYKLGRAGKGSALRPKAIKGAKYAGAGAAGALAVGAGYGLVKARVGRSQHVTQVNIVAARQEPERKGRGRRRRGRIRRDRQGRFR